MKDDSRTYSDILKGDHAYCILYGRRWQASISMCFQGLVDITACHCVIPLSLLLRLCVIFFLCQS